MDKKKLFSGIRIISMKGYGLNREKCSDGEYRQHYFFIKDDGTLVHYLKNYEDTFDDIIVKEVVQLDNGLRPPYVFEIRDERGVGFSTYTPQSSVGGSAALGAALGGAAGAVIGAAAAAQANANAPSYNIPITYSTGLSFLFFNGVRIEEVSLFYNTYQNTNIGHLAERLILWKDDARRLFNDEWIERKFGKARGFYDKYQSNGYIKSASGETLAKHVAYYNSIVQYCCTHKHELSALNLFFKNGNAKLIGEKWESNKYSYTGIGFKEPAQYIPAFEEALKKDIQFNIAQIIERDKWLALQYTELDQENHNALKILSEEHQKRLEKLYEVKREVECKSQHASEELSSLGALKFKKKNEKKQEIEALSLQSREIETKIEEENKSHYSEKCKLVVSRKTKKAELSQKANSEFISKPYHNENVDADLLDGLMQSCPNIILEEDNAVEYSIYTLYCILHINRCVTTNMALDALNAEYIWKGKNTKHIDKETLYQWLSNCKTSKKQLIRVDEKRYLDDDLWMIKE